jgi:hypothetical protein
MLHKNKKSCNILAFLHMSVLVFLFLSPQYFFINFIEANDLLVVYWYQSQKTLPFTSKYIIMRALERE